MSLLKQYVPGERVDLFDSQKLTCRQVLNHTFISKANLKKSRARFFSPQTLLAEEAKRKFLACPVFNLKALEFGAFFAYFTVFGTVEWYDFFQNRAKTFDFEKLSDKKKHLNMAL